MSTGVSVVGDSRERMVRATVELLSERGYAGTSFAAVMAHSGAPRGSIYHHFPGGKQQLVAEAIRRYADEVRDRLVGADSALGTVAVLLDTMQEALRSSQYRRGCLLAAVGSSETAATAKTTQVQTTQVQTTQALTAQALAAWRGVLATAFTREGVPADRSRRLAAFVVAAVEGATVLARMQRDLAPLADVARELDAHLCAVLPLGANHRLR